MRRFSLCARVIVTIVSVTIATTISFAPSATAGKIVAPSSGSISVSGARVIHPVSIAPSGATRLQSAMVGDSCVSWDGGEITWLISGWLLGAEEYVALQDPDLVCCGAYPFTVEEIRMVLNYAGPTTPVALPVQIVIRVADTTNPTCPAPGALLYLSDTASFNLTTFGTYELTVALDAPYVLDGPYFVGFIFPGVVPAAWGLGLITDATERLCRVYNAWDTTGTGIYNALDTTLAFLDLGNDTLLRQAAYPPTHCFYNVANQTCSGNTCFDFDGRLLIYSKGTTAGLNCNPAPVPVILGPRTQQKIYLSPNVWLAETAGTQGVDSAVFHYRLEALGSPWMRLGVDANGATSLRRAVAGGANAPGMGWSWDWTIDGLAEGNYFVRGTIYDTSGRTGRDSVALFVEPTPPLATLTSHEFFNRICDSVRFQYTFPDENVTSARFYRKTANLNYAKSVETMSQFSVGDADNNPSDGNPASQGEFGDYYGAPTAGAIGLRYWYAQGYINSMRDGIVTMTREQAAEKLALYMKTRANLGTTDEWFVHGFRAYLNDIGSNELKLEYDRVASYSRLRANGEELGLLPIIAMGGATGKHWLVVDGFAGPRQPEGYYLVNVSDPVDGLAKQLVWRDIAGGAEVFSRNEWRPVDIVAYLSPFAVFPSGRTQFSIVTTNLNTGAVSVKVDTVGLAKETPYFIITELRDGNGNQGFHTHLTYLQCAYAAGDYDADGSTNVGDLTYLISYVLASGVPPVGGAARADANCDTLVNISDILYFVNWIFGGGPAPCQ